MEDYTSEYEMLSQSLIQTETGSGSPRIEETKLADKTRNIYNFRSLLSNKEKIPHSGNPNQKFDIKFRNLNNISHLWPEFVCWNYRLLSVNKEI